MGRQVIPIAELTRRLPEVGRIKDGVRDASRKGAPRAIEHLRFTGRAPDLLSQIAGRLGGEVVPYSDPKSTDTHEVLTTAAETPVVLPPDCLGGTPQYEMYDGGGRSRWCDGVVCEMWRKGADGPEPYDTPCPCAAAGELSCKPTIHLSVILPWVDSLSTWRLTTHSHNAAQEMPGMVELIQTMQERGLRRGVLRLDRRRQTLAGVTRNFIVPMLDVAESADALEAGTSRPAALARPVVGKLEAGQPPREGPHGAPPQAPVAALPEPAPVEAPSTNGAPGTAGGGDDSGPPLESPPAGALAEAPQSLRDVNKSGFDSLNRYCRGKAKEWPEEDRQARWEALAYAESGGRSIHLGDLTPEEAGRFRARCKDVAEGVTRWVETDDPRFLGWTLVVDGDDGEAA